MTLDLLLLISISLWKLILKECLKGFKFKVFKFKLQFPCNHTQFP